MPESTDRGALTEAVFYILLALQTPLHGYGIMRTVAHLTDDRVVLGAGTLYGALNTLTDRGWIEPCPDEGTRRRKTYCITPLGTEVLGEEIKRLRTLLAHAEELVKGERT